MLRIGVVNRTVSVFLDGNLIYTDCPDLDNRIGYLELPMLEFDKAEPVVITLPADYVGHTLTIAQSSPIYSEKQNAYDSTVYPCDTYLYCGYAYESGLISDTVKIIIPAALLFSLGLLLCSLFAVSSVKGKFFPELIVIAIASFIQMCGILAEAPFFYKYFPAPAIDPIYLCHFLSISVLLLFFIIKTKKHRILYISAASIQILTVSVYVLSQLGVLSVSQNLYTNFMFLPQPVSFFALGVILICSIININKNSKFLKYFSYCSISLLALNIIMMITSLFIAQNFAFEKINIITTEWKMFMPNLSLKILWYICFISATASVIAEYLSNAAERRAEIAILEEKNNLALESYNNLRRQSEEIMMIRHDTIKHYKTIRSMLELSSEKLYEYIDKLIGETQSIRTVVRSNNEILDILINGKLSSAAEKKIKIEIERSEAPKSLPISDTELCSLVVNILDNAILHGVGRVHRCGAGRVPGQGPGGVGARFSMGGHSADPAAELCGGAEPGGRAALVYGSSWLCRSRRCGLCSGCAAAHGREGFAAAGAPACRTAACPAAKCPQITPQRKKNRKKAQKELAKPAPDDV